MDCSSAREKLGPCVDGELGSAEAEAVGAHVRACGGCARELARLEELVGRLEAAAGPADVQAPAELWSGIEQRLRQERATANRALQEHGGRRQEQGRGGGASRRRLLIAGLLRRPMAAAASLALLLGIGAVVGVWLNSTAEPVAAATVDYSLLLDGVGTDVDGAVDRFVRHYHGETISADAAAAAAPGLEFRIPAELPGGFRRGAVYRLRFGPAVGIAARYHRGGEPLVVFFHPPVEHTKLGVHRESCCQVAGREGQRVEVGPWQLIHFTDPTTCHCLLSKVNDEGLQSAIFAAIAPSFPRPAATRPAETRGMLPRLGGKGP